MYHKLILLVVLQLLLAHSAHTKAQKSFKWGTVKNGEGINALLLRNHLSPNKYYSTFIKLNRDLLNKRNQLITGKRYRIPLIYPIHEFPFLGEENSRIPQTDNILKGTLFYLVSGHGGLDPGATGNISGQIITEDEYAYDIVLRLARSLISHGAKVELIIRDPNDGIRESRYLKPDRDEVCYPSQNIPSKQSNRLHQRAAAINMLSRKYSKIAHQRLLMIHLDSRNKNHPADVFFYHHSISKKGKSLARTLQTTLRKKYAKHQPNRSYTGKVGTRRLYMLKTTVPPSTFVELGNINNKKDQRRFILAENRETLAQWLCEGLIQDYLNSKKRM